MFKIRVGVLRGGIGYGYYTSLKTGACVIEKLQEKYQVEDIFISKDGTWHVAGVPVSIEDVSAKVDIVFNCLHGEYGEDGKIQRDLNMFSIPYTGAGVLASAFAMNKIITKEFAEKEGVKTPRFIKIDAGSDIEEKTKEVFHKLYFPLMVKPISMGFSFGVTFVRTYDELMSALKVATSLSDSIMVEEYIKGREASCIVIDRFRNEERYGLPVVEISTPKEKSFFDENLKREKQVEFICPANFIKTEKKQIEDIAKKIHKVLGLKHYSQSDFIVTNKGEIFLLEINTLPELGEKSVFSEALESVGSNLSEFLDHLIRQALDDK